MSAYFQLGSAILAVGSLGKPSFCIVISCLRSHEENSSVCYAPINASPTPLLVWAGRGIWMGIDRDICPRGGGFDRLPMINYDVHNEGNFTQVSLLLLCRGVLSG